MIRSPHSVRFLVSFLIGVSILATSFAPFISIPAAEAAVSDWHKGMSIYPLSSTEYGSDGFKQSVQNFKNIGGNYVNFVIPYYQSNQYSTDIGRGWNTPTDASLRSGIQYVKSLGMDAQISVYLNNRDNAWRAYINPQGNDRPVWYQRYGDVLVYYGRLAQEEGVGLYQLGAEMINVSSHSFSSSNTLNWNRMIDRVKGVYAGKLTYAANRAQDDQWGNEAPNIGFWDSLDYVGMSAYYALYGNGSVESMKGEWQYMNDRYIAPLQRFGKPILFLEIGYRSLDNARFYPWDPFIGGTYDAQEQSDLYTAFHEYWNNYSYLAGANIWWWASDPNYGGPGNTDYTPQNKPAQEVIKKWWLGSLQPPPTGPAPAFTSTGSANPGNPNIGQDVMLHASVTNTGGTASGGIIDFEVYNGSSRVFQHVVSGQQFGAGETRQISASWTPQSAGDYTFKIGVFKGDWSQTYSWNDNAATIRVGSGGTSPPPSGSPVTDIWWPSNGAHVSGVQPFKALLQDRDLTSYSMFWRVGNGDLVAMYDSYQDWPHKEAVVDLSGWNWAGAGPYTITFVSKDSGGTTISERSVQIRTQ